jgi:putative phosphonate metabolism protein
MTTRYAIYFSPSQGSALAGFSATWLGRDCLTGADVARPRVDGFSKARIAEITEAARHYGFHATLKPPFILAKNCTLEQLDERLRQFAQGQKSQTGLSLQVGTLDGFIALLLTEDSTPVRNLAAACVREFDTFRLAPSEEEIGRRRAMPLSALEDALLRRWGYPYVMEAFRFHMTLTSRLQPEEHDRLLPLLRRMFGPVANTLFAIDAISLFHQRSRDSPFRLVQRYPFAGNARNIATKEATDPASGPSLTSVKTSAPST